MFIQLLHIGQLVSEPDPRKIEKDFRGSGSETIGQPQ